MPENKPTFEEEKKRPIIPYGKEKLVLSIKVKRFTSTKKFTQENPECINEGYKVEKNDGVCKTASCTKTWREAMVRLKEWL